MHFSPKEDSSIFISRLISYTQKLLNYYSIWISSLKFFVEMQDRPVAIIKLALGLLRGFSEMFINALTQGLAYSRCSNNVACCNVHTLAYQLAAISQICRQTHVIPPHTPRALQSVRPSRNGRMIWFYLLPAIIFVFGNSLSIHFDESQMHAPWKTISINSVKEGDQ